MKEILSPQTVQQLMYDSGFDVPSPDPSFSDTLVFPDSKIMKLAYRAYCLGADDMLEDCERWLPGEFKRDGKTLREFMRPKDPLFILDIAKEEGRISAEEYEILLPLVAERGEDARIIYEVPKMFHNSRHFHL